jgi:sarcosine oxidase
VTRPYDVVVVGLGTVGAATCMTLARRGISVLGLDAFDPPHRKGSHHGQTRSVRRAYLEGTAYLPMALRAWESWRQLENDSGEQLLVSTANLTIGPPQGPAVSGFLTSARAAGIPHEMLSAADVRKRWPQLRPPDDFVAGLETEAGIVFPERCIRLFLRLARAWGAVLQVDEPVSAWTTQGDGIAVQTSRGRYTAGRVVIAAGARGGRLLGRTGSLLEPQRVPVHWIDPPPTDAYRLGHFPVNFWQVPIRETDEKADRYREFYTLPAIEAGGRVKAAFHNGLEHCDPDQTDTPVSARETAAIRSMLDDFLPSLAHRRMDSDTCRYTLTPDDHFVLGPVPEDQNVFAVALAGHGFKFAPVLGEVLADLIQGVPPAVDVGLFSPRRFTGQT